MPEIVLGVGTSHTPQLSSGWDLWSGHANRDEGSPLLGADGEFNARMTVADYVPGYRSMAGTGTGTGMAFAV